MSLRGMFAALPQSFRPLTRQPQPLFSTFIGSPAPPFRPITKTLRRRASAASARPRPSQPIPFRFSLKHINYDYHPFANQDAVYFRSRDKTWPMAQLTQRRIAATDPLTLWWRVRVPKRNNPQSSAGDHSRASHPFKLRTVRSWAGRRVRNVMVQALAERRLDRSGAVLAPQEPMEDASTAARGGEDAVSLMGTLVMYAKESILGAAREEVLKDVQTMLARVEHDVRIRRLQGKVYARTGNSSNVPTRRPLAAWTDARGLAGRGSRLITM